jgi:hypothetical protein
MILYVIIAAILGLTGFVVFFLMNGSRADLSIKKILLSSLLFVLLIGVCGLTGMADETELSLLLFIVLQILYFALGILFNWLLDVEFFGKFRTKAALSKTMLLIANLLLGMAVFTLVFEHFRPGGLSVYYSLSALSFPIPYLFMVAFNMFASIPPPIYKLWHYQADMDEPDFDKIDLNNIYLLELEFSKAHDDPNLKNYKARAPIDMVFGEWFRSFVKNYNYKFEEDPIEFLDAVKNPYGWIFFTKPRSMWESRKYIDPDQTIKSNRLTEKTIIGAKRVEIKN